MLKPGPAAAFVRRLTPAKVCAALRPHLTEQRAERIDTVLAQRLTCLTVVVENLHDPHNGAAALRSAEGVGLQDFHAVEQRERFPIAKNVARSCDQWMDLHRHATLQECYGELRRGGFAVWASTPAGSVPLEELPVGRPLALVFGNERDGLTEEALTEADGSFAVGMHGFTGSFNLSVSVALAIYTQADRMRAAMGRNGDLPAERLEWLRALWYCLSVRAAGPILEREL
ncbi:MAG: RNA methyltransferase [bacterium]